jgi:hypothetical protein
VDPTAYFTINGSLIVQNYDSSDYWEFNRTTDTLSLRIAGVNRFVASGTGVSIAGPTAMTGDASVAGTLTTSAGVFLTSAGYLRHAWDVAGWDDRWNIGNGTREWTRPGVIQMSLDFAGNLFTTGTVNGASDERVKEVGGKVPLSAALDFVEHCDPTYFKMRDAAPDGSSGPTRIGFIAQDVYARPGAASLVTAIDRPGLVANPERNSPADKLLTLDQGLAVPALLTLALRHALDRIAALEARLA